MTLAAPSGATLEGYPLITGSRVAVRGVTFDLDDVGDVSGHCGTDAYSLDIEASDVTLRNDMVTQADIPERVRSVGVGVAWSNPVSGVTIADTEIHDVGGCEGLDHGIYVDQSQGAQIYDNTITDVPHGGCVQLYPNPSDSRVYGNTCTSAGVGFLLGGGADVAGNEIYGNMLSDLTGLPSNNIPPNTPIVVSGRTGAGNSYDGHPVS